MSVSGFRSLCRGSLRLLAASVFLEACVPASLARAAELSWSAPPECGEAASVRAQVEQLAQRSLEAVEGVDFEVKIARRSGSEWQLSLRTRSRPSGPERSRELFGVSCRAVKDAVAVAIAMTITVSERSSAHSSPSVAPHPQQAATPVAARLEQPSTPLPPNAPRDASAETSLRAALGAGLALDIGSLPALAPGAQVELTLRLAMLRVTVLGNVFVPQAARLPNTHEGADFGLALGAALGCVELAQRSVHWLGCAGFELGWVSVKAVNVTRQLSGRLAYGPRAELGLRWQVVGELGLMLRIGGTLPLARDEFVVDQRDLLHQSSATSLRTTIGVEYAL